MKHGRHSVRDSDDGMMQQVILEEKSYKKSSGGHQATVSYHDTIVSYGRRRKEVLSQFKFEDI
jgi:hypothetical protein